MLRTSHLTAGCRAALFCLFVSGGLTACGGGGSSGTGGSGDEPRSPPPNQAPTATASPGQTVLEGATVTLSGAASSDADGTVRAFEWRQTDGPIVSLSAANTSTATFTAPLTDSQLTLTFQLTVTDDRQAVDSTTTVVTVRPSEEPTADAGPDQTAVEQQEVALSAAASSDSDGSVDVYAWTQTGGPRVTLSDPGAVDPTFTAPPASEQIELTFEVRVTDNTDDSSTDSTMVTVLPNEPPLVLTAFPCDACRIHGKSITVTGGATPGADLPAVAALDSVAVVVDAGAGGVPASMFDSGFWIAENVPVNETLSQVHVTVTATDTFGEQAGAELSLQQRPTITSAVIAVEPQRASTVYLLETDHPQERISEIDTASGDVRVLHEVKRTLTSSRSGPMIVDSAGRRLLWQDTFTHSIIATDIATGRLTTVSGDGVGTGPSLSQVSGMALDNNGRRLVVRDHALDAVLSVDLNSGDRSTVADNAGVGTGPAFAGPGAVAVDGSTGQVYVAQFPGEILVLDPVTGNRTSLTTSAPLPTVISSMEFEGSRNRLLVFSAFLDVLTSVDAYTGMVAEVSPSGASGITTAAGLAGIDAVADRYVVGDFGDDAATADTDALIEIDPATGARQFVYKDSLGSGPGFEEPRNVGLDPWSNRVYVLGASSLWSVDVSSGIRALVSGPTRGTGDTFVLAIDLALDGDDHLAYVLDVGSGVAAQIFTVDLATGDRQLISGSTRGSGPDLPQATAIVLDEARGRLLVSDDALDAVVSVELTSGDRTVFSGPTGIAPLVTPLGMALDRVSDRLIVTDEGNGATTDYKIFGIDLETGLRTVLNQPGSGFDFTRSLTDVAVIEGTPFIFVAANDSITFIDLDSGARAVLASTGVGSGESVIDIHKLALDPLRGVVYAWSLRFEALFQFDALSGDRVVLSK